MYLHLRVGHGGLLALLGAGGQTSLVYLYLLLISVVIILWFSSFHFPLISHHLLSTIWFVFFTAFFFYGQADILDPGTGVRREWNETID